MITRLWQQLVVQPADIPASRRDLQVVGTFNPGAVEHDGHVVLMVRVAECPRERRAGFTPLPRWENGRIVTDWLANDTLEFLDPRGVRRKEDGLMRLTFTSHLRVFRSRDGRVFSGGEEPAFYPVMPWEEYGVEDPRIVYLDDRYWMTYVAVSRHGAATALASTVDFVAFERHGIIFCPENKDVILFPERVAGHYVTLHRPTTAHSFCRPEMWLARSPDLLHWGAHEPLHGGDAAWESDRVGGGTPPIHTPAGWIEIYHASRRSDQPGVVGTYVPGVMLLDGENPARVIACGSEPLWEPDKPYEVGGFVPRVAFPTGVVYRKATDLVQLYYGAADTYTALVELRLSDLERHVLDTAR